MQCPNNEESMETRGVQGEAFPLWRGERKRVTFEKQEYALGIQAPELFQLPLSLYCFWRSVCYTGFGFCLLENNRLT